MVQVVKDDKGMTVWSGPIGEVLAHGEYDQGDRCLVDYDELYDLHARAARAGDA
jgi:hypothetical protein